MVTAGLGLGRRVFHPKVQPSLLNHMSQSLSQSGLLPLLPEPLLGLQGPRTELPAPPWPQPQALLSLLISPQWFVLNDTTTGRLHLRLEWLSLIADPEALTEVSARWWGSLAESGAGHVWAESPDLSLQASSWSRSSLPLLLPSEHLGLLQGSWDP